MADIMKADYLMNLKDEMEGRLGCGIEVVEDGNSRYLHDVEPLHRVQRVEDVHAWRGVRMEREGRGRRESRGEGVQLGATRRVRYALASGRLGYARRGPVSGKWILHGSGGDFDRGSLVVGGE